MTPDEFMAAVRYFGEPKIPDGVAASVITDAYTEGLARYPADVLALAAKRMLETRKHRNFPLPEECTRYCREAQEEIELRREREAKPAAKPASPWSPERIKLADDLIQSDLGRQAADEGWIVHLHDWCREHARLPLGREAERVRADGLEIKADREAMARLRPDNPIVNISAVDAKRKRLVELAFG